MNTKLTLINGWILGVDDQNLAKLSTVINTDTADRSPQFIDISAAVVGSPEAVPRYMRLNAAHITIIQRG
jgi:hypothetical protein